VTRTRSAGALRWNPPLYDLGDLKRAAELSWEEFGAWVHSKLEPCQQRTNGNWAFEHGFHCDFPGAENARQLALGVTLRTYEALFGQGSSGRLVQRALGAPLKKTGLKQWTDALFQRIDKLDAALASDVDQERSAHAKKKAPKDLCAALVHNDRRNAIEEVERSRAFLSTPDKMEQFFWQRVQENTIRELDYLSEVDKAIKEGRCPEPLAYESLHVKVEVGSVVLIEDSGAVRVVVAAKADCFSYEGDHSPDAHAWAVCAPVQYQLSVAWAESQEWPRWEVVCHAPSCGRNFYSARPEAKRCPGSLKCRREWMNYQNWLKKMYKSPATDWDNEHLRKVFSSQYCPRKT
jgi:hypothetical protein